MDEETKKAYRIKRDVLLSTIKDLFSYWNDAERVYKIVSSKHVTPEYIDDIIDMINEAILDMKSGDNKKKLVETMEKLKTLKKEEELDKEKETKKTEQLLENL